MLPLTASLTARIRRARRKIEEFNSIPKRLKLIAETIRRFTAERKRRADVLAKMNADDQRTASNSTSTVDNESRCRSLHRLAFILLVFDIPIQTLLWRVALGEIGWLLLFIFGIVTALGVAAVTSLASHVFIFDADRIERSRRLNYWGAGIAGTVVIAALIILGIARLGNMAIVPYLTAVMGPALVALGESLPVAAGFVIAAALALGHRAEQQRMRETCKSDLEEVDRFLAWLQDERERLAGGGGGPEGPDGNASVPVGSNGGVDGRHSRADHTTMVLLLAMIGIGTIAGSTPIRAQVPAAAPCLKIEVDASGSVNPQFREEVKAELGESTADIARAIGCREVSVGSFADEGAWAPSTSIEVPTDNPVQCKASPAQYENALDAIIAQHWAVAAAYRKNQTAERCAITVRKQDAARKAAASRFSKQLAGALGSWTSPRGRCTNIYAVVKRDIAERPQLLLVATDAAQTCKVDLEPLQHLETSVVLLLIPSKGPLATTGPAALERAGQWQRLIPGLRVVFPDEVTDGYWVKASGTDKGGGR